MAPSSEEPNQLQPSGNFPATLQQKPATVSVKAGSSVITDIGDNAITAQAEQIRYTTDEAMVWQETPSLALLVPRALKYLVLLAIVIIACSVVRHFVGRNPAAQAALAQQGIHADAPRRSLHKPGSRHRAAVDPASDAAPTDATSETVPPPSQPVTVDRILLLIECAFGVLFTVLLLAYLLKLKTTRYSASSQRLIVEEGSLHSVNRPYELHKLGDAVIVKPLLLRMFGVSNLTITQPHIELYGLRNAAYVRDILRQGGQLEAQRVDKIRWR